MSFLLRQLPRVSNVGTFDPDEADALQQFNSAFRVVSDRVGQLHTTIKSAMEAGKAQVAEKP